MRPIKGYNNMSKERLLSVLSEPESAKSKKNLAKIKKIKEDFNKLRDSFLTQKQNKIEKIFMKQKTKINFLNQK